MDSKMFPTHFIPEFQVHQLPCQGRSRTMRLPTATNDVNSKHKLKIIYVKNLEYTCK